jgi:hypothetical protein
MIRIPLIAQPNQSLNIILDGNSYDITIKETTGKMCVTLSRDGVEFLTGHRVTALQGLIPYRHQWLGFGQFIFDTPNDEIPYWENFESNHLFYYLTDAEIE